MEKVQTSTIFLSYYKPRVTKYFFNEHWHLSETKIVPITIVIVTVLGSSCRSYRTIFEERHLLARLLFVIQLNIFFLLVDGTTAITGREDVTVGSVRENYRILTTSDKILLEFFSFIVLYWSVSPWVALNHTCT